MKTTFFFQNLRIRTKLLSGFILIGLFVGVVGFIGIRGTQDVNTAFRHIIDVSSPMLVALLEIKNSAYEIEIQTISFELLDLGQTVSEGTIGGDKKYVLLAQVERLDTWVERYERVRVQHGLAQTELVQKLREAKQRVVDAALEFLRFTELDAGQSVILHQREEMQEARNNLKTVIRHAIEDEMMELRRHKQQVDESVDTTIRINHLVSLLAASLALFIGIVLSNRIGNPLMALRDTALEISRGAWHRRTQIKAGGGNRGPGRKF